MVSATQQQLIDDLQKTVLNGRYERISCISVQGGKRRGVLSLVFQAHDRISNSWVAIKVMDPDRVGETYRLACFEREPKLLELVEGKYRCLQIVQGLDHYNWEVQVPGMGGPIVIPCRYFVTEWIEEDVDDYFMKQDAIPAERKLQLFRNTLLAIEAMHSETIFHRDIKMDNIRLRATENGQIVVAIDYGTAASIDTPKLNSSGYKKPVGAPAYAPPEAFCGFADRPMGRLADSYALGSLLFGLFNARPFHQVLHADTRFNVVVGAVVSALAGVTSETEMRRIWGEQMRRFNAILRPPDIEGPGHTVPASISAIINDLYARLIQFNFIERLGDLQFAVQRVDCALRTLSNAQKQANELERKRILRKRRQEQAREKQDRLSRYLAKHALSSC